MAGRGSRRAPRTRARVLALTVVSLLAVLRSTLLVVTVAGSSMTPTYAPGDRVLVRRGRRSRPGQVVVFRGTAVPTVTIDPRLLPHHPAAAADRLPVVDVVGPAGTAPPRTSPGRRLIIKRLVAVAGDPVPADVVTATGAAPGDTVPPGYVVVRGDGTSSIDSRHWGYLPVSALVGQVVADLAHGSAEQDEGYNQPRSMAR